MDPPARQSQARQSPLLGAAAWNCLLMMKMLNVAHFWGQRLPRWPAL